MTAGCDPTDPALMTADERLHELAGILARGALRCRRGALPPATPEAATPPDSPAKSLDLCAHLGPDGQRVNASAEAPGREWQWWT